MDPAIPRGAEVKILRPESYWFNDYGKVISSDTSGTARYPYVVRFTNVNYAGVSTNNYSEDELQVLNKPNKPNKPKDPPAKEPDQPKQENPPNQSSEPPKAEKREPKEAQNETQEISVS